ncbi:unnamed protein product [Rotaria socialis]|uniref:Uncharacterized protein n=3 Tax=Rotaria socialis TaxID=392032 RepID=A0A820VFP8_9BILA|nr:unnamed protein product [Rotaria socialis]CAF3610485.1 unnamed protein product [Rotaria socialis]CAF3809652.1 unnamed protein product [Rotaria socialis]CAF4499352.1 unnamed protein product [Rotaria socialis]
MKSDKRIHITSFATNFYVLVVTGFDFHSASLVMDPNSSWQRSIDGKVCPKDQNGNYTQRSDLCHGVHMAWHKTSEYVDKVGGGTGEYDRTRYEAHKSKTSPYKDGKK